MTFVKGDIVKCGSCRNIKRKCIVQLEYKGAIQNTWYMTILKEIGSIGKSLCFLVFEKNLIKVKVEELLEI